MKILTVTYGPKDDLTIVTIQLPGEADDAPLKPAMAKRAARIATGGVRGVTVVDDEAGYGYRISSEKRNSHRKFEVERWPREM